MPAARTVTLEAPEWQLLITTLQGTIAMMNALAAIQGALLMVPRLPITTDMIVNITCLAERIETQVKESE